MHATNIISYTHDGSVYCAYCAENIIADRWTHPEPVLASEYNAMIGEVCDRCCEPITEETTEYETSEFAHTFDRSHFLEIGGQWEHGCHIKWNGSATFNVFGLDQYGRPDSAEIDVFTHYDVSSEADALAVMREWVRDHKVKAAV